MLFHPVAIKLLIPTYKKTYPLATNNNTKSITYIYSKQLIEKIRLNYTQLNKVENQVKQRSYLYITEHEYNIELTEITYNMYLHITWILNY